MSRPDHSLVAYGHERPERLNKSPAAVIWLRVAASFCGAASILLVRHRSLRQIVPFVVVKKKCPLHCTLVFCIKY